MNATEVNVPVVLPTNINISTATSATITVVSPTGTRTTLAATIPTTPLTVTVGTKSTTYQPGYYALRYTLGTDFPTNGTWTVQLVVLFPDGTKRIANTQTIQIGVTN